MVYPKISIITPNYNYGHFLEATILSVINQNYPNLEYIIIDGGSTDGSVEIIKKYESYLTYWVSEPDKGMYDAVNKGFAKSSGEIMAWLNSDDMYFPWALKTIAEVFTGFNEIKWVSTLQPGSADYQGYVTGFGKFDGFSSLAFSEGKYAGIPGSFGFIQQESTFWKRELWYAAGGFVSTNSGMAGDFELWCRFFQHTNLFGIISPLGMFRFQLAQQTSVASQYANQCIGILKKSFSKHSFESVLRKITYKTRLNRIPGLMHFVRRKIGYEARIVVREDKELPTGKWSIQTCEFL